MIAPNINKNLYFLSIICTVSIIIRLLFCIVFVGINSLPGESTINAPDENKYHNMALSIIEGYGFRNKAYNPPGYPLFLSGVYSLCGFQASAVRIIQTLLSSLMLIIIFYIAHSIYNAQTAYIASIISCLYPYFIFWTGALLTETLFITLFILAIYCIYRFIMTYKQLWNITSAITLALTTLVRPVVLVMPLFIALFYCISLKPIKKVMVSIFIFFVVFCATLAPWTIRNYFIFNRIIPVSTSSGINLLAGMNKKILANINMVGRLTRSGLDEYNDYLINLNENNRDKEATKIALSYYKHLVRENPQFILKVIWIKWKAFWNIIPRNRGMVAQVASVLSFGILLPFFVLGIIISIRNKKTYLLFFSIANTLIICMIYYANIRYRFPIEPFFIIIASSGILFTYNKLVRHS